MEKHDPRKGVRGEMHAKAKLDWGKVDAIRENFKLPADHPDYLTQAQLAEMYGVSTTAIALVRAGRTWVRK